MTKFKFGDKVSYRSCKNAFYLRKTDGIRSLIAVEKFGAIKGGVITVITNELTPASDWVKCSERMPEFNVRVLVVSGNRFSYDFLLDMVTHSEWASLESWDYWMYAPEMPEVKE